MIMGLYKKIKRKLSGGSNTDGPNYFTNEGEYFKHIVSQQYPHILHKLNSIEKGIRNGFEKNNSYYFKFHMMDYPPSSDEYQLILNFIKKHGYHYTIFNQKCQCHHYTLTIYNKYLHEPDDYEL